MKYRHVYSILVLRPNLYLMHRKQRDYKETASQRTHTNTGGTNG